METINKEGTSKTPAINFDAEKGLIEIKGRSIPENSIEFYEPLLIWLDKYSERAPPQTTVNFHLEYLNTSSSKFILDVFKRLNSLHNRSSKTEVIVNWYYDEDDEDMLGAGEDYQAMVNLSFKLIELKGE
ncbi:MAG: DUF1987 domain-containing protein [Bacteroidota bacterium]